MSDLSSIFENVYFLRDLKSLSFQKKNHQKYTIDSQKQFFIFLDFRKIYAIFLYVGTAISIKTSFQYNKKKFLI